MDSISNNIYYKTVKNIAYQSASVFTINYGFESLFVFFGAKFSGQKFQMPDWQRARYVTIQEIARTTLDGLVDIGLQSSGQLKRTRVKGVCGFSLDIALLILSIKFPFDPKFKPNFYWELMITASSLQKHYLSYQDCLKKKKEIEEALGRPIDEREEKEIEVKIEALANDKNISIEKATKIVILHFKLRKNLREEGVELNDLAYSERFDRIYKRNGLHSNFFNHFMLDYYLDSPLVKEKIGRGLNLLEKETIISFQLSVLKNNKFNDDSLINQMVTLIEEKSPKEIFTEALDQIKIIEDILGRKIRFDLDYTIILQNHTDKDDRDHELTFMNCAQLVKAYEVKVGRLFNEQEFNECRSNPYNYFKSKATTATN